MKAEERVEERVGARGFPDYERLPYGRDGWIGVVQREAPALFADERRKMGQACQEFSDACGARAQRAGTPVVRSFFAAMQRIAQEGKMWAVA